MATYVICKNRQDRKIDLEVCKAQCKEQWECDDFNEVMFDRAKGERAEKPAEGMMIGDPEVESDDTDVKETDENIPCVKCGRADLPLHYNRQCPECFTPPVPVVSKAQQLYDQVLSLKAEIEVRWFELGKILEEIFEHKHYRDLGFETWKNFIFEDLEPLGMKWRTVDYLRTTVMKCEEVGITKEVAGQIGWSKLKEIVPVVTEKNRDHWIDVARRKETTVQMLWGKVQIALGKKTEKEVEILIEKMFFPLFPEQKQIVELSLEVAGRVDGSDKKGHLLADVICPSFLAEYPVGAEVGSRPEMIVKLLGRFGAAFKVRFTGEVVDLETGEILVESK